MDGVKPCPLGQLRWEKMPTYARPTWDRGTPTKSNPILMYPYIVTRRGYAVEMSNSTEISNFARVNVIEKGVWFLVGTRREFCPCVHDLYITSCVGCQACCAVSSSLLTTPLD